MGEEKWSFSQCRTVNSNIAQFLSGAYRLSISISVLPCAHGRKGGPPQWQDCAETRGDETLGQRAGQRGQRRVGEEVRAHCEKLL